MDHFLEYFLPRLSERVPDCTALIEAIAEGYEECYPCMACFESASSRLFHFCNFRAFCNIFQKHRLYASFNEPRHNGEGVGSISFSRTGNLSEGFPLLMNSDEWNKGDGWCVIRVNFDGDSLNRLNRFRQRGRYHGIKVKPFDWAHHEFGDTIADNFELDPDADGATVDTGKTWMMHSDGCLTTAAPVGSASGYSDDRTYHPYAQAEDRLTTTAKYIPNAEKYISGVDIILAQDNFGEDNLDDRRKLSYMLVNNPFLRRNARVYADRRAFERGDVLPEPWRILRDISG